MAGAYTAKVADAVLAPGEPGSPYPPGWPSYPWPFPGPYPPGYTPDLSYNLDTGSAYQPEDTHGMSATLRDQADYGTSEPDNDITWTANINGTPIELKFSGDAGWSGRLISNHSEVGDYYGAEPTFVFNVDDDNAGDIINLIAMSKAFDNQPTVVASAEIRVVTIVSAVLTLTINGYKGQWDDDWNVPPWVGQLAWAKSQFGMTELYFGNNAGYGHAPYSTVAFNHVNTHEDIPADPHWIFNHGSNSTEDFEITCPGGDVRGNGCDWPRIIGNSDEGTVLTTAIRIRPYAVFPWQPLTYEVKYKRLTNLVELGGESTFNLSFSLYDQDSILVSTVTKTFTMGHIEVGDATWQEWLTLDGTSKEVTVINP